MSYSRLQQTQAIKNKPGTKEVLWYNGDNISDLFSSRCEAVNQGGMKRLSGFIAERMLPMSV